MPRSPVVSSRDEKDRTRQARRRLRNLTLRLLARRRRQAVPHAPGRETQVDRGLLLVDVQNDFITGVLPVAGAARIIPTLNRYLELFAARSLPVYLARDWHPPDSAHFAQAGGSLPAHAVAGTLGAAFPDELQVPVGSIVIPKGTMPREQGYSAFAGHHPGPATVQQCLASSGIRTVYVGGLGPGVPATLIDGCQLGFDMVLLVDAVRGIDGTAAQLRRTIDHVCRMGARVSQFDDVARELEMATASASAASSLP